MEKAHSVLLTVRHVKVTLQGENNIHYYKHTSTHKTQRVTDSSAFLCNVFNSAFKKNSPPKPTLFSAVTDVTRVLIYLPEVLFTVSLLYGKLKDPWQATNCHLAEQKQHISNTTTCTNGNMVGRLLKPYQSREQRVWRKTYSERKAQGGLSAWEWMETAGGSWLIGTPVCFVDSVRVLVHRGKSESRAV